MTSALAINKDYDVFIVPSKFSEKNKSLTRERVHPSTSRFFGSDVFVNYHDEPWDIGWLGDATKYEIFVRKIDYWDPKIRWITSLYFLRISNPHTSSVFLKTRLSKKHFLLLYKSHSFDLNFFQAAIFQGFSSVWSIEVQIVFFFHPYMLLRCKLSIQFSPHFLGEKLLIENWIKDPRKRELKKEEQKMIRLKILFNIISSACLTWQYSSY